jgi:protein TonB
MKNVRQIVTRLERESITEVVLGASKRTPGRRWILPLSLAMAVHVGLTVFVPHEDSGERWALTTAERVHALLAALEARPVEIPVRPPAQTEPPPTPDATRTVQPSPKRSSSRSRAQAPAQAAQIVASVPAPSEPIDLGDAFVVGGGTVYVGGSTTASGTATRKVDGPAAAPSPPVPRALAELPDRSRPLGLTDPDWTCPWPSEADDSPIDEEVAIVRVEVSPDGQCESASVVRDPGHGFGTQAARCAKQATFLPALDRHGNATRSATAIRVRFVR